MTRALTKAEIQWGCVRPVRRFYVHTTCQTSNTFDEETAVQIAKTPDQYKKVWCITCKRYRNVAEYVWAGSTERVGS